MRNLGKSAKRLNARNLSNACLISIVAIVTSGCSGGSIAIIGTNELCADWRPITVSKNDQLTEGTATQIEASNRTREVWGCHATEAQAG